MVSRSRIHKNPLLDISKRSSTSKTPKPKSRASKMKYNGPRSGNRSPLCLKRSGSNPNPLFLDLNQIKKSLGYSSRKNLSRNSRSPVQSARIEKSSLISKGSPIKSIVFNTQRSKRSNTPRERLM